MDNEDIDFSLKNIWKSWFAYRKGKKISNDMDCFQYNLESELLNLWRNMNNGKYKHGSYRKFKVTDNKTREISVASIKDRVVHRLVYDYLTKIYDKTFIYDAWSCRKDKGLIGAINRAQAFMKKYKAGFVWKADVKKFFDSVDRKILLKILEQKIKDKKAINLITKIILSFSTKNGSGMPIGNLTSQIFSNIYLNELDRHIKHSLKCRHYLRYGDDFIIFNQNENSLIETKIQVEKFVKNSLKLDLNIKNNLITSTKEGLKFLGVILSLDKKILNKRNSIKIKERIELKNAGSYWGIVSQHCTREELKEFQWRLLEKVFT